MTAIRKFALLIFGLTISNLSYAVTIVDDKIDLSFYANLDIDGGRKLLELPNGKIIVAGNILQNHPGGSVFPKKVVRLNSNGSLDPSFNSIPNDGTFIHDIELQPDGKILLVNGNQFIRLNSNGSIDSSFSYSGSGPIRDIQLQTNGKIMIVGYFGGTGPITWLNRRNVARLNANGSIDQTFISTEGPSALSSQGIVAAQGTAIQDDGKILVTWQLARWFGQGISFYTTRFENDGSLDTTFGQNGTRDIGYFWHPNNNTNNIGDTKITTNGKILVGLDKLIQLDQNGDIDTSFDPVFTNSWVRVFDIEIQPDGKIIVSGSFGAVNQVPAASLVRLNIDGSVDETFVGPTEITGPVAAAIEAIELQSDGKVLAVGNFRDIVNTNTSFRLARFNTEECEGCLFIDWSLSENTMSVGSDCDECAELLSDLNPIGPFVGPVPQTPFPTMSHLIDTSEDSKIKLHFPVSNLGTDITPETEVKFYFSKTYNNIDNLSPAPTNTHITPLNAGEINQSYFNAELNYQDDFGGPLGNYYLIADITTAGAQGDLNESNHRLSIPLRIVSGFQPTPIDITSDDSDGDSSDGLEICDSDIHLTAKRKPSVKKNSLGKVKSCIGAIPVSHTR